MAKLITIAGPQSSGKTTLFNILKNRYSGWRFIEELNPYKIVGKDHPGAAFTDKALEAKLINKELKILKNIDSKRTTVVETGIFHVAYAEKFCGAKAAGNYLKKYIKIYQEFEPLVFFIDTKPEVSWRRRQEKYFERIKKLNITDEKEINKLLFEYQKCLFSLYPLWIKYLDKIPFKKIVFRNSYVGEEEFIRESFLQIQKFLLQ